MTSLLDYITASL